MNLSLCHKCCVPIDLSTQLVAKLKLRVKVKNNQIRKYMDKHISCIYTVGHKIERPPEWRISCIYTVSCEIKRPPEWKDNQIRKYMDKCISCIYTQSVVKLKCCCRWDNNTYPKKLKFCKFIPWKYKWTCMSGLTSGERRFMFSSNNTNNSSHMCENNTIYSKAICSKLMEIQLKLWLFTKFGDGINTNMF